MKRRTIIFIGIPFSILFGAYPGADILDQNAFETKNQQFRVLVNNSLDAVVLEMEKQETIDSRIEEIDIPMDDSVVAIVPTSSQLARQLLGYQPDSRIHGVYREHTIRN